MAAALQAPAWQPLAQSLGANGSLHALLDSDDDDEVAQQAGVQSGLSGLMLCESAGQQQCNQSRNDGDVGKPPPFATKDTLLECTQYLQVALKEAGMHTQLVPGDQASALNCIFDLLEARQRANEELEGLKQELQRAKCDLKTASRTIDRLSSDSDQKEQQNGSLQIKLRQLEAWYRDEVGRLGCERDDMARRLAQYEQRHVQFQHEVRRKEGDLAKLQERVKVLLAERRKAGSASVEVAAAIHRQSAQAGKRLTRAEQEEQHKRVMEAYEAQKVELTEENTALKRSITALQCAHKELLNRTGHWGPPNAGIAACAGDRCDDDRCATGSHGSQQPHYVPKAAASLQQMHANLQLLRQRAQGAVANHAAFEDLAELAQSPGERVLLSRLRDAGSIMQEQERALALALDALGSKRQGSEGGTMA